MNSKYEEFITSLSSDKSASVARSLSSLGEFDYTDCDVEMVTQAVLSTNPTSIAGVSTACTYLKKYAEFLGNDRLVKIIVGLDKREILGKAKLKSKYISYGRLQEILHDIDVWEEHNSLYYQTLFWSVYEGIYCADLSVIKNLRAKDIDGEKVTLRPDTGESYELVIPIELSKLLIELAEVNVWEQTARYGYINLPLIGSYPDSCFKMVKRDDSEITVDKVRMYCFRRLKKIATDYVEFNISIRNIYISGIMHRIQIRLDEAGYSVEDAFSFNRKKPEISAIISDELKRSHFDGTPKAFRALIAGHLNDFAE